MTKLPPRRRTERSSLPASLFTTSVLAQPDRFAAWQQSIGVIFDVRSPSPEPIPNFNARVESYLLEDVILVRCSANAQKFDRAGIKIARDSIDHYMIQLFLAGHVDMNHRGRSFRVDAGGLVAFDFTEVMDTFNSDFDLLSIIIPRRRLSPLLRSPDSLQGACVDPETGPGALLANFARTVYAQAPALSLAEGCVAARTLVDLIALAFNGVVLTKGDLPEVAHAAELMRAQAFIKDRLAIDDLGPDMVATELAMSRASLYRLFAPIGGIAEYIREQRLRRCLADLLTGRYAHRQIADIAYSWGFRDPVYFAKAFKQRFGRTPSEAREARVAFRNRERAISDDRTGDRLYEEWLAGLA